MVEYVGYGPKFLILSEISSLLIEDMKSLVIYEWGLMVAYCLNAEVNLWDWKRNMVC